MPLTSIVRPTDFSEPAFTAQNRAEAAIRRDAGHLSAAPPEVEQ